MTYSVKAVFATIQGEGLRAGTRAVFVRFTGCNLWAGTQETRAIGKGACARWCDTDFTPQGASKYSLDELVELICETWGKDGSHRWVVFTGGEPWLQLDRQLVVALSQHGFKSAVETNGHTEPQCMVDWTCCSPKLNADGSVPTLKISGADELKVVVGARTTAWPDWTDEQLLELQKAGRWGALIVQPIDECAAVQERVGPKYSGNQLPMVDDGLARCIAWVGQHPEWRLGYQLHKVVGLP